MSRVPRGWWIALAVLVIVLPASITLLGENHPSGTSVVHVPTPPGVVRTSARIPVGGNVGLAADVIVPRHGSRGAALVVMPAPWGGQESVYDPIANSLAHDGYDVVTYTQRGFLDSGGLIDFAGPDTQADARSVITWALQRTGADPKRVGMFGLSYGAGISLLTAAHDPRVRAVAALSTWTDMATSFAPDSTPSKLAVTALVASGKRRFADSVVPFVRSVVSDPKDMGVQAQKISPDRSAMTYVDQLNHNDPAIFLANGYEDSYFPPQQLVDFYGKLTTPKRLQLAPGDHGGPEHTALDGRANATVSAARRWLDHYLRGADNGIDHEAPIQLRDLLTGATHEYDSWPQLTAADAIPLGAPNAANNLGSGSDTWSSTITAGGTSGTASGGVANIANPGAFVLPVVDSNTIDSKAAFIWTGPTLTQDEVVSGSPQLHVELTSSTDEATVYAYLYDVKDHTAGLVTTEPETAHVTAGEPASVTITMQPTSWTARKGDHLMLVVDTSNLRYQSLTPAGAKITVSSTSADPATIGLPVVH